MKRIKSKRERNQRNGQIRGVIGLLFIILLFFKGGIVDAGMNDSKLEKNRLEGVYAITTVNGQARIFYLNMYTLNGIPSYCIEMGVDITTDIYHSTDNFGMSMLSNEAIEYIRSISYFGYGYPGHEDYHYYMAAQELIWEYLSGNEVEWSNEASVNGTRISIDVYKNEILTLRKVYYEGLHLNFNNGEIYKIGDKLVISDRDGLLSSYEVESSGHSNVWMEGNTLQVEVATDYVGEEKIILKRKEMYSYSGKLYYYDSSQRLISVGNFLEQKEEVSFTIEGETLFFQVVDGKSGEKEPRSQSSFDGAVYELYRANGEFVDKFQSDEFGKSSIHNLPYGNYIVRQVIASRGYLVNSQDFYIIFDENSSYFLLEQDPIFQKIEILKLYDYCGLENLLPEENVSFSVYDLNDNFLGKMVTDSNGVASILLSYGYYRIQQDNTSFGYTKIDDFEIFVDVPGEKRYDLLDDYIECQLKIVPKDDIFKEVSLGEGFQYKVWDKTAKKYLEFQGTDVFVTDETGELLLSVLVGYGEYRIEQVGVPVSYIDKKTQIDIVVDDHSDFWIFDGKLQLVVEFSQELKLGNVDIFTQKEVFFPLENGYEYVFEKRENVEVELIAQEDIVVYGEIVHKQGEVIQSIITDEEGESSISSLYLGNYCLIEKESKLQECFQFDNVFQKEIVLKLFLKKMEIDFFNRSEVGEGIEGTIVEVKEESGQVIYTGITDEEGKFKIINLPSGQYCFFQKKVKASFSLLQEEVCFEIDDSKEVWEIQMINSLAPKKWIVVPNTFVDEIDLRKMMLLILIGVGGFIYRKKIGSLFGGK